MTKTYVINSPIGSLCITAIYNSITHIDLFYRDIPYQQNPTLILLNAANQLTRYFNNPKHIFNLPLNPQGTKFQQKVWEILQTIPPGTTKTYSEIARQLNSSPRTIGNACRQNPIPIIIPCHRVIARNSLGGYAGKQQGRFVALKKWLLMRENAIRS